VKVLQRDKFVQRRNNKFIHDRFLRLIDLATA
jgi:hypothetical protein